MANEGQPPAAKKKKKKQPPELPDNYVEIVRLTESTKKVRIISFSVVTSIGLICIAYAVVKLFTRPPWLVLLGWIIAALIGPSGLIYLLIHARQKFVTKHHRRVVDLEIALDKQRTSSDPEASKHLE